MTMGMRRRKARAESQGGTNPPTPNTPPQLPDKGSGRVIRRALDDDEYRFAQEIVAHRGGILEGPPRGNYPGIDGTLDGQPISLKDYSGDTPGGVLGRAR